MSRRRWLDRVVVAYITAALVLAVAALVPDSDGYLAYYALFLFTLPVSIVASTVIYILASLFGSTDDPALALRLLMVALWVALAAAQAVAVWQLGQPSRGQNGARRSSG